MRPLTMKSIMIVGLVLAAPAASVAQDPLDAAKDLYASAAYDEALSALTRLHDGGTVESKQQIDQYRSFCLYALGRTAEAESIAESLLRTDPLMALDESAVSPRIEEMFATVRKRLLPELIREEYRLAKSARDAKSPADAEPHLIIATKMLATAQSVGAWNDSLADLAVLVEGFLDLTRARLQTQTVTRPARAAVEPPAAAAIVAAPVRQTAEAVYGRVFDVSDRDVTPPVAIRQVIPPTPRQLLDIMRAVGPKSGLLDVIIDETGTVQDAVMRQSLNSVYDGLIIEAARTWKYRPAMKGATPVRYLKAMVVTVGEREESRSQRQ